MNPEDIARLITEDPDVFQDLFGLFGSEEETVPPYAYPSWPQEAFTLAKKNPQLEKAFVLAGALIGDMPLRPKLLKITKVLRDLDNYIKKGMIKGWPEIREYLFATLK